LKSIISLNQNKNNIGKSFVFWLFNLFIAFVTLFTYYTLSDKLIIKLLFPDNAMYAYFLVFGIISIILLLYILIYSAGFNQKVRNFNLHYLLPYLFALLLILLVKILLSYTLIYQIISWGVLVLGLIVPPIYFSKNKLYSNHNFSILSVILISLILLNLGLFFISGQFIEKYNYDFDCDGNIVAFSCSNNTTNSLFYFNCFNKDVNIKIIRPKETNYLVNNYIQNNSDKNCKILANQIILGSKEYSSNKKDYLTYILAVFGFCIITIPLIFNSFLDILKKTKPKSTIKRKKKK
jgi:hypothetical protein